MLDELAVRIRIACDATNERTILGWIAYTPSPRVNTLHFLYVRKPHRRHGIARALYREAFGPNDRPIVFTMHGRNAKELTALYPHAIHLPVAQFLR
jgi:GNAT superfamily N-acetyltransferase